MKLQLSDALAVMYADIFDYPLTPSEAHFWTVHTQKTSKYIHINKRGILLEIRKKREEEALQKWQIANHVGNYLRWIPSIKLVGVTGGLSQNNTNKDDDIDFFIITASRTVWVTRFFATALLDFFQVRRKPNEHRVENKICLNMFISEDVLAIHNQNLYTAHEILQMKPLWYRENVYWKFMQANLWVKEYLPNAFRLPEQRNQNNNIIFMLYILLFVILEPFFYFFQKVYMNKKLTSEQVTRDRIAFHPHNAEVWVKEKFARRLKKYKIPIDKIFYQG